MRIYAGISAAEGPCRLGVWWIESFLFSRLLARRICRLSSFDFILILPTVWY
jgi:hypothetical protein